MQNLSYSVRIVDKIEDSIQVIKFSPFSDNYFATGSWDCYVRVYSITSKILYGETKYSAESLMEIKTTSPILSLCWMGQPDNPYLIVGLCEGNILMIDIKSKSASEIGNHEIGAKAVIWIEEYKLVCSGGWDGYIHFWDGNTSKPVSSLNLGKRIISLSLTFPKIFVGLTENYIGIIDLNNVFQTGKLESFYQLNLHQNIRDLASTHDFISVAQINRVQIDYHNQSSRNYRFVGCSPKSYSTNKETFTINGIALNPEKNLIAIGCSNGELTIFDIEGKNIMKSFMKNFPITAIDYSPSGSFLIYAQGNDWGQGANDRSYENIIFLSY